MGFFRDGTFTISFLNLERFSEGDFDFPRDVFTGRYTVTDGMIKFKLDEKMLLRRSRVDFYERDTYDDVLEFNGYLGESGALIIDLFEYHIDSYVEEFSA